MNGKNSMLEIMLEDANRLMKFSLSKENSLTEGEHLLFLSCFFHEEMCFV